MADGMSDEKVHKSLVMDKELAGAIGAWAAGAGVGFSEAVRRLCVRGLAAWPGPPGTAPDELVGEVKEAAAELRWSTSRILDGIEGLRELHAKLADALRFGGGSDGSAIYDGADGAEGRYGDEEGDDGGEYGWSQREFDEWWEGKKSEWN